MNNEGWLLQYQDYEPEHEGLRETLCTLGNGYFCSRGAAPDAQANEVHYPGTYLSGGYNRLTSEIKGRKVENEDLVNIPNWLVLQIRIEDGPWLRSDELEFLNYRQTLHLRRGLLSRKLRFRDHQGRISRIEERRLVSMADPHLAGLELTLTPENWSGRVSLRSGIDGAVINDGVARYRDLESRHLEIVDKGSLEDNAIWLLSRTVQSRMEIAQAARTRLFGKNQELDLHGRYQTENELVSQEFALDLADGESLRIEKTLALYTSRDMGISEPSLAARNKVQRAAGFEELLEEHQLAWKTLWEQFDLEIESEPGAEAQMKLRVHIFHLLQTVSRHIIDRDVGVPPRGWHGEAYRAHIMWDELFIFPLLNLRRPNFTRALLHYRYRRLPAARRLAREAGYKGAMFPWQSGSSGREESQKVHLNPESGRWIPDNSNRQRHISSAIAYNVWQYYEVTDDHEFLEECGAEILIEVARFWASIASWNAERERYDICGVMGPDEFHTAYPGTDPSNEGGLDNNAYTNLMATWVINRAQDALDILPNDCARRLREFLKLADEELEHWLHVSRNLFVPFHDDGIISQFEGYEELEEFEWHLARKKHGNIQRLDRILEAEHEDPNRYKASKQADVLMLFYLFSAEELQHLFEQLGYPFNPHTIPKNVDYYLNRTSHGSTLSWIVHSWVLARTDRQHSWKLFLGALDSDIEDIQGGTAPEGIHLGAMAGTVDLIQRCYIGIETRGNILYFNPALPDHMDRLKARLRYRNQELDIDVTKDRLQISSRRLTAEPITIAYRGRFRCVSPGSCYEFRLIRPEERHRGAHNHTPSLSR